MPDEPSQSFFLKLKNLFSLSKNSEEVLKNTAVQSSTTPSTKQPAQIFLFNYEEACRKALRVIFLLLGAKRLPGAEPPLVA